MIKSPVDLTPLPEKLRSAILKTWEFHTITAPGILIGCCMVEKAKELLNFPEPEVKYNAISETRVCLVDCLQVLTGCTLGNKYLKLQNTFSLGRYACTLYNRGTGIGYRVHLDHTCLDPEKTPYLYRFATKTRDPQTRESHRKHDATKVMEEFCQNHDHYITARKVKVLFPPKEPLERGATCRKCAEGFLVPPDTDMAPELCAFCSGQVVYYQPAE